MEMTAFRHFEFAALRRHGDMSTMFHIIDVSGDGVLSKQEWSDGLARLELPGIPVYIFKQCYDLIIKYCTCTGGISEYDLCLFCKDQNKVWGCMPSHAKAIITDA